MYAYFIENNVFSMLEEELKNDLSRYIWEDDGDIKHRTQHTRNTVNAWFAHRIDCNSQASKCADVWPIENVWGILYENLKGLEFENMAHLKEKLIEEWQGISPDICMKMMTSIPRRFQTVVNKKGEQINKRDYKRK